MDADTRSFGETLDALVEGGPQGISRFAETLVPAWISDVLASTGKASIRRRKLPAEQAIWLFLGMGLFADRSIGDVVDHLSLVVPGPRSLAWSAVPKARYRLGAEPIESLFRKVGAAGSGTTQPPGFRGLSLHAIDGRCMRVQDSDPNFEHFGKPGDRGGSGDAGYPQLRIAILLNLDSRMLVDAAFGQYATSEEDLGTKLWLSVPDDSLTLVDRGFNRSAPGPISSPPVETGT